MFRDYLLNSFAMYSAYHKNKVNQIIHVLTIPLLVWTIMIFTSYLVFYKWWIEWLPINLTIPLVVIYVIIYFILDYIAAFFITPIFIGMYIAAGLFSVHVPYAWAYALGIHVSSWIAQLIGHAVFEKRRPAFTQSIVQAFVMAPVFVIIEIMFACGRREELQDEVDDLAKQYEDPNDSDKRRLNGTA